VVSFEGREVAYDFGDLDELALAYAMSIHKSQGSEYPCVIIPVHTQHYLMRQRNLLYMAVTRGKKLVILVGTKKALAMAVRRQDVSRRYTDLRRRLAGSVAGRKSTITTRLGKSKVGGRPWNIVAGTFGSGNRR